MIDRITKSRPALSLAEQKVADWVIANPHQTVEKPLAWTASAIGVSEPTIVRFCRSVGATGFRDLKVKLAQDLARGEYAIHSDVSLNDDATEIITKVIGRSIQEIDRVRQSLNPVLIDEVSSRLASVHRIDFYGVGASGVVVSDAQNKFFRLGLPCVAYWDSPTILQAAAITDNSYGVIAVSKTGESKPVIEAAKMAKKNGAQVIAITSPHSSLAEAVDIAVLVDVDEDTGLYTPMSSRMAQLAVLDVIQVAFALRLGKTGMVKLDKAKSALLQNRS